MNWNEWRMKWFLFWLFVACLLLITVGCSHQEQPKPIQPDEFREKPLDWACDLNRNNVEDLVNSDELGDQDPCESVMIAETYWFDEPGIEPHTSFNTRERWN